MRRNRSHYSALFGAELLLISVLVLVVSGPALAQTAAGSFVSVSGQVQIQRAGATIGAASGVGVDGGGRIVAGADGRRRARGYRAQRSEPPRAGTRQQHHAR